MATPSLDSTALICRPSQLAEAAVVLAAIPSDRVVPVLVLEPAPLSRQEYDELYAAYTAAREGSMENVVGLEFRAAVEEIDIAKVQADIDRHHELHARLSVPRSWLTHQGRWSELLYAIPCERAIFLFEPSEDDLTLWPTIKAKQFFPEKSGGTVQEFKDRTLLPTEAQIICFVRGGGSDPAGTAPYKEYTYDNLVALTDLAWSVLRPDEKPQNATTADPTDPGSILVGLHQALEEGIPLRCSDPARTAPDAAHWLCTGPDKSSDCVLVERLDSAASIAAVVYARYSGAQLMVCPAPDISRVDEAIASFRHDQQQATKMARFASRLRGMTEPISEMSDADKTAILDSMAEAGSHTETEDIPKVSLAECIKRYIFGDWRGDAMHQIELAVSANVPPKLIDAVGDRPLTAFTSGIPYTFVRNSGRDWSTKPIGHISFDGPLIVATHVWVSTQTAPKSPFAAIFDPGFFETTETRDVAAVMDRQFAYPIVFSNTVATLDGLRMASHLPLDLLFFNTHGSDDSIVLGAQTFRELKLKNESLVQWVALDSAPIVFNNSCLSWRGVGREFVRVGARGYIGTLWPVSAPKAARFAARAMGALADGASVAAAICQAELDDETRRAYIYAGLGPVRILSHAGFTERRRREYVLDVLDKLLEAMLISARILQPDENRDLARFGLREVASLFRRPELSQAETAELYALRAKQLKMLANVSHHIQRSAELDQELLGVIVETFRLAEAISKATGGQPDDFPELLWARSRIRRQVGDITGAIADLEASLRATKGIESDNLVQQVDLVELLKDAGDWKRALEIAIATKAQAENGGDREARMRLAGVLGQLERRLKNYDKSLSYVEEGYGLAMELENRPEQAEFKLDEARIQMHKKNYEAAIAATTAAGIVARACLDIGRSLASHGVMAQVLLKMGDAVASRESAERGLKVAQRMNDLYEQAGFHNDIAAAYKAEGNIQAAVKEYRDSLLLAGRIGRREMLSAFPSVSDLAVSTQDWPLIEEILSDHLAMQYRMSPEVRQASIVAFLNTLRNAVRVPPPNYARRSMLNLLDRCAYLVNSIPEDPADDIRIAGRTLQMIVAWLLGAPEAHEIARELDERWKDGGWNWGAFVVDQPPA